MKKPKDQTSEVLYLLLTKNGITCRSVMLDSGIINLSARLSDLKHIHGVGIELKPCYTVNKFGRKIHYGEWNLSDRESALEKYNEMVNSEETTFS